MSTSAQSKRQAYEAEKAALDAVNAPPSAYARLDEAFFGAARQSGPGWLSRHIMVITPVAGVLVAVVAGITFDGPKRIYEAITGFPSGQAELTKQQSDAEIARQTALNVAAKALAEREKAEAEACSAKAKALADTMPIKLPQAGDQTNIGLDKMIPFASQEAMRQLSNDCNPVTKNIGFDPMSVEYANDLQKSLIELNKKRDAEGTWSLANQTWSKIPTGVRPFSPVAKVSAFGIISSANVTGHYQETLDAIIFEQDIHDAPQNLTTAIKNGAPIEKYAAAVLQIKKGIALMFLNKTEESRQIFNSVDAREIILNKDRLTDKNGPDLTWKILVHSYFDSMRQQGRTNPIMAEIETTLQ